MEHILGPDPRELASRRASGEIQRAVNEYGGPDELVRSFLSANATPVDNPPYHANILQLERLARLASRATLPLQAGDSSRGFLWGAILGLAAGQRLIDPELWPKRSFRFLNQAYRQAANEAQEFIDELEIGDQRDVLPGAAVLLVERFATLPEHSTVAPHISLAYEYASEYSDDTQVQFFTAAGFTMQIEAAISLETRSEAKRLRDEAEAERERSSLGYLDELEAWDGYLPDNL